MQRANNRPTCHVRLPVAVARAPPIAPVRLDDARHGDERAAENEIWKPIKSFGNGCWFMDRKLIIQRRQIFSLIASMWAMRGPFHASHDRSPSPSTRCISNRFPPPIQPVDALAGDNAISFAPSSSPRPHWREQRAQIAIRSAVRRQWS